MTQGHLIIGKQPANLPKRLYTPYKGETAEQLGELLKRRNPVAQSSVSALSKVSVCRRIAFFQTALGLTTPQGAKAAKGDAMHKQIEAWMHGGSMPTHPSILMAIRQGLLPAPAEHVKSEVEFWLATGVPASTSPDGQLWLKGYIDLVEYMPEHGLVSIKDFKTKDDPDKIESYAMKEDEMSKDPQMGVYSHVVHTAHPNVDLTVGHLNLSRDESRPGVKEVKIALRPLTARSTYLKLLRDAETLISDCRTGDWKAVPGNYAKCDSMYGRPCDFRPICHGAAHDVGSILDMAMDAAFTETPDMNPFVNDAVAILPPDAAPPGPLSTAPPAVPNKETPVPTATDFDALISSMLGVAAPAPAVTPSPAPAPPAVAPPSPPAAAVAAPAAPPTTASAAAPSTDARAFDALLKAPPPKTMAAPAVAVAATTVLPTVAPLAPAVPAAKSGEPSLGAKALDALLAAGPKVSKLVAPSLPPAPPPPPLPPAAAAPPSPPAAYDVRAASVSAVMRAVPAPATTAPVTTAPATTGPATTTPGKQALIQTFFINCQPDNYDGVIPISSFIRVAEARILDKLNARPGTLQMHSLYEADHGQWRAFLCAMLPAVLQEYLTNTGVTQCDVVAMGDTPMIAAAVETLGYYAKRRVWGK